MGSLRHFFSTQDELRRFAMREVIETITHRVAADAEQRVEQTRRGGVVDASLALLTELLPLDEQRRTEARIYAAFVAEAMTDPGIDAIRQEADEGMRGQCRHVLDGLAEFGHLHPSRDRDVETERLWSLLDGLTAHLLVRPQLTEVGRVTAVLGTHLADLAGPTPPGAGNAPAQRIPA